MTLFFDIMLQAIFGELISILCESNVGHIEHIVRDNSLSDRIVPSIKSNTRRTEASAPICLRKKKRSVQGSREFQTLQQYSSVEHTSEQKMLFSA